MTGWTKKKKKKIELENDDDDEDDKKKNQKTKHSELAKASTSILKLSKKGGGGGWGVMVGGMRPSPPPNPTTPPGHLVVRLHGDVSCGWTEAAVEGSNIQKTNDSSFFFGKTKFFFCQQPFNRCGDLLHYLASFFLFFASSSFKSCECSLKCCFLYFFCHFFYIYILNSSRVFSLGAKQVQMSMVLKKITRRKWCKTLKESESAAADAEKVSQKDGEKKTTRKTHASRGRSWKNECIVLLYVWVCITECALHTASLIQKVFPYKKPTS